MKCAIDGCDMPLGGDTLATQADTAARLAKADLLGLCLPERDGGGGHEGGQARPRSGPHRGEFNG